MNKFDIATQALFEVSDQLTKSLEIKESESRVRLMKMCQDMLDIYFEPEVQDEDEE